MKLTFAFKGTVHSGPIGATGVLATRHAALEVECTLDIASTEYKARSAAKAHLLRELNATVRFARDGRCGLNSLHVRYRAVEVYRHVHECAIAELLERKVVKGSVHTNVIATEGFVLLFLLGPLSVLALNLVEEV